MESSPPLSRGNLLLQQLEHAALAPLVAQMELRTYQAREVLIATHQPVNEVVFPVDAVMAQLIRFTDGASVKIATIGHEGVIGWTLTVGVTSIAAETICQLPGTALVMRANDFRTAIQPKGPLADLIARYGVALFRQVALSGACNARHSVVPRVVRWLLVCHDRIDGDAIAISLAFVGELLGLTAVGARIALDILQHRGLITHGHQGITVRDRAGLEAIACECYGRMRDEFGRVMGYSLGVAGSSPHIQPVQPAVD